MYQNKREIAIGSDHAGFSLKQKLIAYLESKGQNVKDLGTHSEESADYPDYIHPLAMAVELGTFSLGIVICGSGNGVAMTANKHQGIRAALCWIPEIAKLARLHNDANVLAIPARYVEETEAKKMVDAFLNTAFEGGRHQQRVEKISCKP